MRTTLSQLMCLYQFWRVMGRSVICGFLGSCFDAAEGAAAAGGCWAYGGGDAMMEEEEEEMAGRRRE